MRPATRNGTTYEQNTANIGKGKVPAPATAAKPIPANDDTPKDTPTGSVSASRTGRAARGKRRPARGIERPEVKADFAETLANNEIVSRMFDADDRLQAAMAEATRMSMSMSMAALANSAERTLIASSGEFAEAVCSVKYRKKRADKAEK